MSFQREAQDDSRLTTNNAFCYILSSWRQQQQTCPSPPTRQTNSLPTLLLFLLNPLNPICVDQPLLGVGLPWSVVDIPEAIPLRKTNIHSHNHYQIQIAPHLVLGIQCSQLQHSLLGIWLLLACLGLVSAVTSAVIFYVHLPCCVWKTLYP